MDAKSIDHFKVADEVLYGAYIAHVDNIKPIKHFDNSDYMRELCRSIVGQQLSIKAAATIWGRFNDIVSDWQDAGYIITIDDESMRECGLSYQKISYIKNIAHAVSCGQLRLESFGDIPDNEVIIELTKIKGIGKWTAEMFLIFILGRGDVFSAGDLGLRNAIKMLYSVEDVTHQFAEQLSLGWAPHRSDACRILWASLDNNPISS